MRSPFGLISLFMLSSCITVNVNFPEAAVQQAADSYVEQLYRLKEEAKQKPSEPEALPNSGQRVFSHTGSSLIAAVLSFGLPRAEATEGFQMSSPVITAIQSREVGRLSRIDDFKKQGLIGENNRGLLEVRGEPKPLQKKAIEKLISEENADRQQLFKEVIKINGLESGQLGAVSSKFMSSFQSKSPAKTWMQDSSGKWNQK